MNKQLSRGGFTLVELLVVITIIGILAGIALPVFQKVQINAEQTKDLSNGKQIALALKLFAGDNDGYFPRYGQQNATTGVYDAGAIADANIAYKQLIPSYVGTEKIFNVKKSAWSPNTPDENISTEANKLAASENGYAYMLNLTDTSKGSLPIVFDAVASGAEATGLYAANTATKGGIWEGKKAIIIRVDQSGKVENLSTTYAPIGPVGGATTANILITHTDDWLAASQTIVNPNTP